MKLKKVLLIPLLFLLGCAEVPNESSITPPSVTPSSTVPTSTTPTSVARSGVSTLSVISGSQLVDQIDPLVKWEGRYEYKVGNKDKPSANYIYHTATGFTIDFVGTELEVSFYTENNKDLYFDYAIDNEVLPNPLNRRFKLDADKSEHTVKLGENLSNEHHTIKCLKMSEAADGIVGISEFKTDGKFMYRNGLEQQKLKFMFVNASSGSGHGDLAYLTEDIWVARTTKNSSSLHSYMYLTARMFDGDVMYVSQSGWGIRYPENKQIGDVIDYAGITPSNDVEGAQKTGKWDHEKYVPDIIIFHIGGNDTKQSGFKIDPYKEKAVELIDKLHTYYPHAKMIFTHTGTSSGSYAVDAIKDYGAIRRGYFKEVITPKVGGGATGTGTYGANNHQSLKTNIDASNILSDFITTTYGIEKVRENITFEEFEFLIQRVK